MAGPIPPDHCLKGTGTVFSIVDVSALFLHCYFSQNYNVSLYARETHTEPVGN
jgi:hypothetical protein